jgi:hypothetical protein
VKLVVRAHFSVRQVARHSPSALLLLDSIGNQLLAALKLGDRRRLTVAIECIPPLVRKQDPFV